VVMALDFVCGPAVGGQAASEDQGVLLVDNGQAVALVVWDSAADDEPYYELMKTAVEDHLLWAIEQITGVRPAVTNEMPDADTAAIVIGRELLTPAMKYKLKQHTTRFDTRMIASAGNRIYLAGATRRGDTGAIADFIHDDLKLKMFGPDPVQWNVPHAKTLRVTVAERIDTPAFVLRSTWYDGQTIPSKPKGNLRRQNYERFRTIAARGRGMSAYVGHNWHRILPPEMFEEHPEYFAENNGERKPTQACISNPKVVDLFVDWYIKRFNEQPEKEIESLSPNDGDGYCRCAKCRAMHKDLGTRLVMFFNEVGRRVAEKHPDKYLGFYAYAHNERPPKLKDFKLHKNVIPVLAHYYTDTWRTVADAAFNSKNWDFVHNKLIPWAAFRSSPYFFIREYMTWWHGPWPMYRSMMAATRKYADYGANGVTREYQSRDFGSDLHMYLENRMLADPYQDGQKLLDRTLNEYYGPAADTARDVSFEIEDALRRGGPMNYFMKPRSVSAELLIDCANRMDDAAKKCEGNQAIRVQRDVRYLRCAAACVTAYETFQDAKQAADSKSLTEDQCKKVREHLQTWLDLHDALQADGLKGRSWISGKVAKDSKEITDWLAKNEP